MSKQSVARYQRLNQRGQRRGGGSSKSNPWRYLLWVVLVSVLALGAVGYYLFYAPAVRSTTPVTYLFVSPGSGYNDLKGQLHRRLGLRLPVVFDHLAARQGLTAETKLTPGRYAVPHGASMPQIIDLILSGETSPLELTAPALRTTREAVDYYAQHLWVKRDSIARAFADSTLLARYGARPADLYAQIIRSPMSIPWESSAEALVATIHSAYTKFWQGRRSEEAARLGLTPLEVTTLASIVESESAHPDEYRRIAGLYLNRLHQGLRLQSDPTVKYAVGDFSLKRIRSEHLRIESPYNTYRVKGLPPTPILVPRVATIDSVLEAEQHDYIYMCAKSDFSGYHDFAVSYSDHLANAKRYQQALDARGIH